MTVSAQYDPIDRIERSAEFVGIDPEPEYNCPEFVVDADNFVVR